MRTLLYTEHQLINLFSFDSRIKMYNCKMKHLILLSFICTFNLISAQVPGNGLVAYFPFYGNARDTSMYQTHGTVVNASLTSDRFGNPNYAYAFHGNSYISFSVANVLNAKYSYSLWAKIDTLPSGGDMAFALNIGSNDGDQSLNIANNFSGGFNGWLGGGYNTSTPHFALNQNAALSTASWAHIVCVRDSNHAKLYINGALIDSIGSGTVKTPSYGSGTKMALIGIRNIMTGGFKGRIDDVCIYNRPLSKSEILQLYNDQSTSTESINVQNAFVRVYPNPAFGFFTIQFSKELEMDNIIVEVTNSIGQRISTNVILTTENTILVNSHHLSKGIYYIQVKDKSTNLVTTEKVIVQ